MRKQEGLYDQCRNWWRKLIKHELLNTYCGSNSGILWFYSPFTCTTVHSFTLYILFWEEYCFLIHFISQPTHTIIIWMSAQHNIGFLRTYASQLCPVMPFCICYKKRNYKKPSAAPISFSAALLDDFKNFIWITRFYNFIAFFTNRCMFNDVIHTVFVNDFR